MRTKLLLTTALLLAGVGVTSAQINVSSDGSDGAFNPAGSVTINLAQAIPGAWNDPVSPENAGKGIYDRDKQAIIFKYSSVNIASGRTVTFSNHPTRAAVVWLVSGSVTISGVLNLNGNYTGSDDLYGEPGPGGFRGGLDRNQSVGLGIGGGAGFDNGKHSTVYGNPSLLPLIGGSGSGGGNASGAGGGGAILIAASNSITVNGTIQADSNAYNNYGSSGAIRLVANSLSGSGTISAWLEGRIRLEANSVSGTFWTDPQTAPVFPTVPVTLWPAEDNRYPVVKIVSIDGNPAPVHATGAPMDVQADVDTTKAANQASTIVLRTQRFSTSGSVKVRAAGKYSPAAILSPEAALVSGNENEATWQVSVILPEGFTCLQAIATHTP